jgi:hypothetical protein
MLQVLTGQQCKPITVEFRENFIYKFTLILFAGIGVNKKIVHQYLLDEAFGTIAGVTAIAVEPAAGLDCLSPHASLAAGTTLLTLLY